ncbi:unnamed protein product, partial [Prorocentrum cordatum]
PTGTLEFLFDRLADTSGAVQVSAVALLAQSWASEPVLFRCFRDLCPGALPSLFRVPGAASVFAEVKASGGSAGAVVPIVTEIALRLCNGGVVDTKASRKARRRYFDVKREQKNRKRLEGDESGDEGPDDEGEDDACFGMGVSKAQ